MKSPMPKSVQWIEETLRNWRFVLAYLAQAYLFTAFYLLYGMNIIEWDLLHFCSSSMILLRFPMRELCNVIDSSIISFCCGQINNIFGSSWASNASLALPSWLAVIIGTGHGSFVSIDCSRLTLNIVSMAVMSDYLLSSYLMDQNTERMLSSSALVIVWIFIDRNRSIALPLSASPCSGVGGKSFSALQRFVSFVGQTLRIKQKSASESTINTKVRAVGKISTAIPSTSSHGHHANTSGLVSAEGSQCHTAATGNLSPPPTNMLLPSMYYLLCSAVSDGFITTFVACISTKLAATPMYPIHSRSACRTLSMSAGLVFTLFHLLEKIVTQRVSITLMGSAIERSEGVERNEEHREKEKQREKEKDKDITSSGGSGVSQGNNMMSSNFSALFPTYTLFLAKFMFKRDVGCVSLSNSPLVSLILITVTVVLMLQAILISIFDARRRLGALLLSIAGIHFVAYTKRIFSKQ